MKNLLLIGCGHMGNALLTSWINSKKYNLTVIDPIKYRLLKSNYKNTKIDIFKNSSDIKNFSKFDTIIFATKPIDLNNVFVDLSSKKLNNKTIIISIIAGKKINLFKKNFNKLNNFFRVMPNMPAAIGQSMNCITSNKSATKTTKNEVINLFSLSGKTIFLDHENQIDMSTAISGSGPGFVYNIIDAMEKAAIKLGFNKKTAKILISQTFKGSINLMLENRLNADFLVKTVATKGGTTEAGLKVMKEKNLHKVFVEVVKASYKKAKLQGK